MNLRPMGDWILVKMDPIPEKIGSLFTVHGDRVRQGIVQLVGPGKYNGAHRVRVGVEKGERVAFFRETLEHQQGKKLVSLLKDLGDDLGDDLGLIRESDVLFVIAAGEKVTVSG